MKTVRAFTGALLLLGIMSGWAVTQSQTTQMPANGGRNYDPKNEATITGAVQEVLQQAGRRGWNSTHLVVKTDQETVLVHLGPSSYLDRQGMKLATGDTITVVGSRTTIDGKPVLIAREITSGGKTVVLRDAQGIPNWSRGRGAQN